MKDFFEKNKVPVTIIVAAFLIAASIWLSKRLASISPQNVIDRQPAPLQLPKTSEPPQSPKTVEPLQQSATRIDYTEAANHVGEYACVSGKIDHVYTSNHYCPVNVLGNCCNSNKYKRL